MMRQRIWVRFSRVTCALGCIALAAGVGRAQTPAQLSAPSPARSSAPTRDYLVLVASESVDRVSLIRFGPGGAVVERERYVGWSSMEVAGPHGVAVTPDAKQYFVSTAHGSPFGSLTKYNAATDREEGRVMLGNFPATAQVTPDGSLVFVVNFNLHGEMEPSDVSVVSPEKMVEIARITTCTMPHGSRISTDGTKHYSACMMDDMLVEIDTRTLTVARHFVVTKGAEKGASGPVPLRVANASGAHDMMGHSMEMAKSATTSCSPTWAQPSRDGARIWVACNASNEIIEIDAKTWQLVRRLPAGTGVYNLAVTHDGTKLIATNKRDASMSVFDAASGKELARIPTTRKVVHGVVVSDDDRYAFVSVEGIGSEPGTVDVIDLVSRKKVASVDVGQQAGGIDFVRSEAVKR